MSTISKLLGTAALILQLAGCATVKTGIDDAAHPGAPSTAVVVGRNIVSYNGTVLRGQTVIHVSKFTGPEAVGRNALAPGEFAIKIPANDNGYFAINLPPGRYYIVEFLNSPGVPRLPLGYRSYMPILGSSLVRPLIFTFEAEPGKATYIGTLHTRFADDPGATGRGIMWNTMLSDDTAQSLSWLAERYPRWSTEFSTQLLVPLPAE